MDVITSGFLGPFQNVQYSMKKLRPCVKKVPETFFPRPITPRCHSFAVWVSNTSLVKVKTAILRVLSKNKIHQRLKPATKCCFEKIIIEIFSLFPLVIASSLLDHWKIDRHSADISIDTRPICRSTLVRYIDRHSTNMSVDTRPICWSI